MRTNRLGKAKGRDMLFKNKKILGIRNFRLVTLAIIGVCGTLALSTLLQLIMVKHFSTRYATKEAELRLQQLAWQMRDSLNRVVDETAGNVQLVSSLAEIRNARDPASARVILDKLKTLFPDYAWIGIADLNGKVFASAQGLLENADVSGRPWFQGGQTGLRAFDFHAAVLLSKLLPLSENPWRFIDVAVPVTRPDGEKWGVLGIHLSWDWARQLSRDLFIPAFKQYGVEVFLVRADNTVLLGPGAEEKKLDTTSLKLAQSGQSGSVREVWPDGNTYLTGYCLTGRAGDNSTLQWSVLVRQPEHLALAAVDQLQNLLLWLSLTVGLVLAVFAAFGARVLTRPFERLRLVVEQRLQASVSGTPLPTIPVINSFREAQVLSVAMREMMLREAYHIHLLLTVNERLEHTVALRTAELESLALQDVLTGLPNRRAFLQKLPEAMRRSARLRQPCAVMFLDLDGFKSINDTYGHEEGDEVLRQFAGRVVGAVRNTDTVARLGGDEFVVILENLQCAENCHEIGLKILAKLSAPFISKSLTLSVSASIGVALFRSESGENCEAVLARADCAMYEAKRSGKNNIVLAPTV